MKKLFRLYLVLCSLFLFAPAQGQFLKKLKEKASQVTNKVVDKKVDEAVGTGDNSSSSPASGNAAPGKPRNKGGAGLTNTPPPDVKQQMTDAEAAYKQNKFSEARYSVQQALIGVELQLGRELLRSLPNEVNGFYACTYYCESIWNFLLADNRGTYDHLFHCRSVGFLFTLTIMR